MVLSEIAVRMTSIVPGERPWLVFAPALLFLGAAALEIRLGEARLIFSGIKRATSPIGFWISVAFMGIPGIALLVTGIVWAIGYLLLQAANHR
jgi:hypothetical protein